MRKIKHQVFRIMREYVREINPERLGWSLTLCLVTILLILTWGLWYSLKKEGNRIKGFDFELGLRHLLHTNIRGRGNFFWRDCLLFFSFLFFFFLSDKKEWLGKALLTVALLCLDYSIILLYLITIKNRGRDTH